MILKSGFPSKFIVIVGRNMNACTKPKSPNAMTKSCYLVLLFKIGQRHISWHGILCGLQIEGLQLWESRCVLSGLSVNGSSGEAESWSRYHFVQIGMCRGNTLSCKCWESYGIWWHASSLGYPFELRQWLIIVWLLLKAFFFRIQVHPFI